MSVLDGVEIDDVEIRVLGCLMEKQVTTPDLYPMTVNALVSACNQTTNRFPVVRFSESDVTTALTALREKKLTRIVYSPSNRAPKHRHVLDEMLSLDLAEQAVLCVLMLRGAQTIGELKGRTERQHEFATLGDVEAVLDALAARERPLVQRLDRQPGQKDVRYIQLVGGTPETQEQAGGPVTTSRSDRVAELEQRVAALEAQIASLNADVDRLRVLLD